jgi:23S rRNA G2445 N2-methylase RlmL
MTKYPIFMRIGVIVNHGFENFTKKHIVELLGLDDSDSKTVSVNDTIVIFETDDWKKIQKFVYLNQIATRVLYLIGDSSCKNDEEINEQKLLDDISKKISKDKIFEKLISKNTDFRSSVKIDFETDPTYLEAEIGGVLLDYAKSIGAELKVNLKNPVINFYVHVHESKAYFGIDLSDDLSKRDYKIFNNAVSLKGPSAFGLLMAAGYAPKDVYVNPCCYSGTIEIEAALYATKTSHRFYNKNFPFIKICNLLSDKEVSDSNDWDRFFHSIDSKIVSGKKFSITGSDKLMSSVNAASKNAKIAGVIDAIDFRRIDLDWMDIKYEEKSVDKIITFIPGSSKHQDLTKDFKQIFYHADYILKKNGTLTIMCLTKNLLIELSKEYFILSEEFKVYSGKQEMDILVFKKK